MKLIVCLQKYTIQVRALTLDIITQSAVMRMQEAIGGITTTYTDAWHDQKMKIPTTLASIFASMRRSPLAKNMPIAR